MYPAQILIFVHQWGRNKQTIIAVYLFNVQPVPDNEYNNKLKSYSSLPQWYFVNHHNSIAFNQKHYKVQSCCLCVTPIIITSMSTTRWDNFISLKTFHSCNRLSLFLDDSMHKSTQTVAIISCCIKPPHKHLELPSKLRRQRFGLDKPCMANCSKCPECTSSA